MQPWKGPKAVLRALKVKVHFGMVGSSVESSLSACRVRLFVIWQIIALKYVYIRENAILGRMDFIAKQPS